MKVQEKLMRVQSDLKAPKGQYNSFGKYKYRSCEDILEAVKPLLSAAKLTLTVSDEVVIIGNRYYIKATATVTDIETGESHSVSALAREDETKKGMDLAQVTGSVSSYARKYALNGLFCIDDTKDSDSTNTHGQGNSSNKNVNTTKPKSKTEIIFELGTRMNLLPKQIIDRCQEKFGIADIEKLSDAQYQEIYKAMGGK